MLRSVLILLAAGASALPPSPLLAQDSLEIRAVRYYRADSKTTLVKAFVEVPYTLLESSGPGPDATLAYQVTARVLDGNGMSLLAEPMTWRQRVPASMKAPGATGLEMLDFALQPGTFRVEVTIEDSVSGRRAQTAADVQGYTAMPLASDLLLSPAMRVADVSDTVPGPGEMRRGSTLIVPAAVLQLTPLRPQAFYFLEAYTESAEEQTGSMKVSIIDSTGTASFTTAPAPIRLGPGGGILKGQIDLDGLPEGRYTLRVMFDLDGKSTERSAGFEMAGLQQTIARTAAVREQVQISDEGYFGAMNEAELDSAAAPLVLFGQSREMRTYEGLSVAAKRRFLADFWKERDSEPATERNEERERFYQAIAYANEQYRVGRGRQELGWQSDRGRIYAKYGVPDDRLSRVQSGEAPPYEVWRYTRGRPRYYVFADRTNIGGYNLVHTNDRQESGIPTWREIVTEEAVRDIGLFLGEDFYRSSGSAF